MNMVRLPDVQADAELADKAYAAARELGQSYSEFARRALTDQIERRRREAAKTRYGGATTSPRSPYSFAQGGDIVSGASLVRDLVDANTLADLPAGHDAADRLAAFAQWSQDTAAQFANVTTTSGSTRSGRIADRRLALGRHW